MGELKNMLRSLSRAGCWSARLTVVAALAVGSLGASTVAYAETPGTLAKPSVSRSQFLPMKNTSVGGVSGVEIQQSLQRVTAHLKGEKSVVLSSLDKKVLGSVTDIGNKIVRAKKAHKDPNFSNARLGIGGGWGPKGVYLDFNSWDRGLIGAGGAVPIAAAVCALPAVGEAACPVIGVVIGYILSTGLQNACGGDVLRVNIFDGPSWDCVRY